MERKSGPNVQRGAGISRLAFYASRSKSMHTKTLIVDDDPNIAAMPEDRLQASGAHRVIARPVVSSLRNTFKPDMLALIPDDAFLRAQTDSQLSYLNLPCHESMAAHN